MNYNEFMKNVEEFVFAESQPEKADIIFVPGNGFPDMAEKQLLYIEKDMPLYFAKRKIQYYTWQICRCAVKKRNIWWRL